MIEHEEAMVGGNPAVRRYGSVAMALHWLIAAAFALQIGLGWRMNAPRTPQTFAVYQLHKSVGITILLLTLARIAWRLAHRPPPLSSHLSPAERVLARTVHLGFYVVLLAMPLSGWLIVSSSKVGVPTYLYGTIPWPHFPGVQALPSGSRALVNGVAATTHVYLAWLALAAIALHVLGALKHQIIDRDDEIGRMVPFSKSLSAIAVLLVAAFVGLIATGRTMRLSPIPLADARTPTPPAVLPQAPTVIAPPVALPLPVATPAPTPTAPAATPTPVPARSSDWIIRQGASRLRFHTRWSQGAVDGGFTKWQASIRFDPEALKTSSVKVTIDIASVTTADGDQQSSLPGTDWFDAAAHPSATWTSASFTHRGGDRYLAAGTLTLRGVSRPLAIPFTLTIAGDVATMTGTAVIDRTAFGVGQGEWLSTADLPASVSLSIAITADRGPA